MPHQSKRYPPIEELIPADWQQQDIKANGIRQHILRTGGNNPPLLLLHGFMESGLAWLRLARALADRYDVIMPEARAHGRSDSYQTGFSPTILTDDAIALIEQLDLDKPISMGHSNGAVTAFRIATQRPDLIRALILEDPPAGGRPMPAMRAGSVPEEGFNWYEDWMNWMRHLKTMSHHERVESAVDRWPYGLPIPSDEPLWPAEDFVGRTESLTNFDITIFDTKIEFWSLLDYLDLAPQISCPTLLLTGDPYLGSLVPEDIVLTLMEQITNFQWEQIEGAAHILSRGRPFEQTLAKLNAFLNAIGRPS